MSIYTTGEILQLLYYLLSTDHLPCFAFAIQHHLGSKVLAVSMHFMLTLLSELLELQSIFGLYAPKIHFFCLFYTQNSFWLIKKKKKSTWRCAMPSYFAFKWISQCSCFVSLHLFCICNPADSSQNCDPIQLSTSSLFIIELTGSRIIRRALGKKIPWCTVHFSPGADLGNTAPFMLVKGGCLWEQPTTTLCHCCP